MLAVVFYLIFFGVLPHLDQQLPQHLCFGGLQAMMAAVNSKWDIETGAHRRHIHNGNEKIQSLYVSGSQQNGFATPNDEAHCISRTHAAQRIPFGDRHGSLVEVVAPRPAMQDRPARNWGFFGRGLRLVRIGQLVCGGHWRLALLWNTRIGFHAYFKGNPNVRHFRCIVPRRVFPDFDVEAIKRCPTPRGRK